MTNKLVNRMTWEEIGEYFANRAHDKGLINKKEKFKEWFVNKKAVCGGELLFDYVTYAYCYRVSLQLQKHENDYFTVIVGGHGSGKSHLAAQIGAVVSSDDFDNNCIIYSDSQYLKVERALKRGSTIQLDEGVLFLNAKKGMSKKVTDMHEFLQLVRFDGVHHIVCIGELKDLIPYVRNFRRDSIIIIEELGYYKIVYDRRGCDLISEFYPKIKKDPKEVKLRADYFIHGENRTFLPSTVDWDLYKKLKKDNLENVRAKLLSNLKDEPESEALNSTIGLEEVDEILEGMS